MEIDGFTFAAQIVNFLILVWLLKRFLYGPIITAMDRREEAIAARLDEAAAKRAEAEQEGATYRAKQEALDQQRSTLLDEARADASEQRKVLMQHARREVEQEQAEWWQALQREQAVFLDELREQAAQQVVATARRVLDDLADVELEAQVVGVFVERLRHLPSEQREALAEAIRAEDGGTVHVRSAFPLGDAQKRCVERSVQAVVAAEVNVQFEATADQSWGIELRVGGWHLAWTVDHYLDALVDHLQSLVTREADRPTQTASERTASSIKEADAHGS